MLVYFWVFLVVVLLRSNPSADEVIANGVRQRQVVVAGSGDVAVLDYRVVYMPAERLLDVGNVLDHGNAAHANLLAPVVIRLHLSSHLVPTKDLRRAVVAGKRHKNNVDRDTFRRPCQLLATLTGLAFVSTVSLLLLLLLLRAGRVNGPRLSGLSALHRLSCTFISLQQNLYALKSERIYFSDVSFFAQLAYKAKLAKMLSVRLYICMAIITSVTQIVTAAHTDL